jgi:hypothetical protein
MQNSGRVAMALLAVIVFALIAIPPSGGGMLVHAYGYDSSGVGLLRLFTIALAVLAFWAVVLGIAVLADRQENTGGVRP